MAKPPNPTKPRRALPWDLLAILGGSALLVVAGILLALQYVKPEPPKRIRIAAGPRSGAYYQYATRYADYLARFGIEMEVVVTEGSVENLALIASDQAPVDLALIQGGVANETQRDQLRGLGSLFYEPLWILERRGEPTLPLNRLAGKRIGIGPKGSGTAHLATRMLAASGIDGTNATLVSDGLEASAKALVAGDLDLMLAVGSPDSPMLQQLAREGKVALQDLPRAAAYARKNPALSALTLPEGTIDLVHNVPARDIQLVAVTANLVARPDLHPALVDLLIEAATEVHGRGSLFATPETFPSPLHSDFPIDDDAERHYKHGPPFLQRYLPFWVATWIDRTKVMLLPLIALIFPMSKILPPVYRWRMRRRILRWYSELWRIDREIQTGDMTASSRLGLGRRLAEIESEAAQIEVPLAFIDQLYNLRLHVRHVEQKLDRLAARDGRV